MDPQDLSKLRIGRGDASVGPGAPGKRRRLTLWITLAVLAAAGAYYAWFYERAVAVDLVTVAQAYPSQAYTLLNATGYVVAQRKASVASKATGRLEWLGVREGSVVKANEVLARLESRDVIASRDQAAANVRLARANLEQGEAELNEAERVLRRSQDLLERKFVSQAAHDAAIARHEKARAASAGFKAAVAVAEASLRVAEIAVEQTLIRAPFDGVVLTKNANVGDVITPFSSALGSQAAVVTMADMSTLEVEADVSEANISKVTLDQPCEIQLDALPDTRFPGRVHRIVPTVDRSKATITAKIRFLDRDPRVLPEMSAKVAFLEREVPPDERSARTVVPAAAVVERNGRSVVYRVGETRVREVSVTAGALIGELREVKGGLKVGDKVVLKPPRELRDGARVALPGN